MFDATGTSLNKTCARGTTLASLLLKGLTTKHGTNMGGVCFLQVRWSKSVNSEEEHAQGLIGDTLVSSAAVAYLGAFTASYRRRLISQWLQLCEAQNISVSDNFELTEFLSEPIEIQKWLNKGLPHDKHSIENASLIKHCRRWPLLIDPQDQASKWITQTENDNGLKIVKASDPSYLRTLESAIPLGQPVLIEVSLVLRLSILVLWGEDGEKSLKSINFCSEMK